jgi:cell division septation protein DedD
VKPENPGGLDISAESETAFETSAGEDRNSQLDTSKLPKGITIKPPEEQNKAAEAEKPAPPPKKSPEPTTAAAPAGVIQLGAFANKAQAERAWTALSARFPNIAAMQKMIVPFPGGIRLRAGTGSAAEAKQSCDALKSAGENCYVEK